VEKKVLATRLPGSRGEIGFNEDVVVRGKIAGRGSNNRLRAYEDLLAAAKRFAHFVLAHEFGHLDLRRSRLRHLGLCHNLVSCRGRSQMRFLHPG
jgi:hypothetical protein